MHTKGCTVQLQHSPSLSSGRGPSLAPALSRGTTVRSFFYPVGRWSKRARKWRKRLCPDAGEQGVTTRGAAPGEQLMPQSEEQRVGNTYLAWTGTCSCNPTAPCSSIGLCFMGDRRQPNTFGMVRANIPRITTILFGLVVIQSESC